MSISNDAKTLYKGYYYLIEQYADTENPYHYYDQLTDVVSWHRAYDLNSTLRDDPHRMRDAPHRKSKVPYAPFASPDEVVEAYTRGELVYYAPLYAYIHSGITVKLGSVKCSWPDQQWDCGLIGMVYVTKEKARAEFPKLNGRTLWLACEKLAKSEVETLDQWLTGDVWGYWIWKKDLDKYSGESCWGFYGYNDCIAEAKSQIDSLVKRDEHFDLDVRTEMFAFSGGSL